MAIHGKATGIILGGYDITSMLNEISTPQMVDTAETTPFGSTAKTYIPGMGDATVSMGGFYEGAADATEDFLDTVAATADAVIVVYGRALAVGVDCKFGSVLRTSFEVTSPVGDVVSISGAAQASGGLTTGRVLMAKQTVSATPTNGTSADNAVATTAGGKAVLSVTGNTRDGNATVVVQHSTDGTTWVDKGTFTVVPAATLTSEVIALSGTINRYTRVVVTLAGTTGSAIVTVALSRG